MLDLPASAGTILTTVRAIASAAPASMSFSSPAASITGQQGLFAQGNVGLFGYADSSGQVNVGGPVYLPVLGGFLPSRRSL